MVRTDIWYSNNKIAGIELDASQVSGVGGPEFPSLMIPLTISLVPYGVNEVTLIQIGGDFNFLDTEKWKKVSSFTSDYILLGSSLDRGGVTRSLSLSIPIDFWKLERIEEGRRGKLRVSLAGRIFLAIHVKQIRREHEHVEVSFVAPNFSLEFDIHQSLWVDNVLPGLGYGKVKVLEVPSPEKALEGSLEKALQELDQARKHFVEGDYDEVVGHCRSAIEVVPTVIPLRFEEGAKPTFPDKVDRFVEGIKLLSDRKTKKEGYSQILKAIWSLGSVPAHPSPPGYFNRADAEFCLLVASASLAYAGKLLRS